MKRSANTSWQLDYEDDQVVGHLRHDMEWSMDCPARDVWPYFKDFNLWHEDLTYDGVIGDREGKSVDFTIKPDGPFKDFTPIFASDDEMQNFRKHLRICKIIPEHLIIFDSVGLDKTHKMDSYYVFSLRELDGGTRITIAMIYAPFVSARKDEAQLVTWFQAVRTNVDDRWDELYIPKLRALVEKRRAS